MNSRVTVYQIMIDFADFRKSRRYSPKEVMETYTVGLTLFHEIDHKAGYDPENPHPEFGMRPDKSSNGIRGVIENTNTIRKELSLMLRKSNQHKGQPYKGLVAAFRNMQEIQFIDESGKNKSLRWKLQKK